MVLVDMSSIASKRATDLERRITTLQNHAYSLKDVVSLLSIWDAGNAPSPHNLDITSSYFDLVATRLRRWSVADKMLWFLGFQTAQSSKRLDSVH